MVQQRPSSRPLQRVVDQVLDPPLQDVIPFGRPGVVQGGLGQQPDADALGAAHQQQGAILVRPHSGAVVQQVFVRSAGGLLLLLRAASDGPGAEPHGQYWMPGVGSMP